MSKVRKGTKMYSIVKLKCPVCHEGNLFCDPNAWKLNTVLAMPDRCPICNQGFEIEPGFYLGALWVSFPIVVVVFLIALSPLLFFPKLLTFFFTLAVIFMFSLQPIIMRLGRAIWINIFVHYDPNASKMNKLK